MVYDASDNLPIDGTCLGDPGAREDERRTTGDTAAAVAHQDQDHRVSRSRPTLAYYQSNGSSVPATQMDSESVINGVALIYEDEVQLTFEISALIVQTNAPDNYPSSNASKLLEQFQDKWNDDPGRHRPRTSPT